MEMVPDFIVLIAGLVNKKRRWSGHTPAPLALTPATAAAAVAPPAPTVIPPLGLLWWHLLYHGI